MPRRSHLWVLAAVLVVVLPLAPPAAGGPPEPEARTVVRVEFLGAVELPTGLLSQGTEVGGLSAIVFDQHRGVYYALSDDPSVIDPARFYTLSIDVSDGRLEAGDIAFLDVTTLRDESGEPFAPNTIDPEGLTLVRPGFLFLASEGFVNVDPPVDPFLRRSNLPGRPSASLPIPDYHLPDGTGARGIRHNLAYESLTTSPDGRVLSTATENALAQDGPAADLGQESLARLLQYDVRKRVPTAEFVYVTDPVAEEPDPPGAFRVSGLVELLALDPTGTFLALERSFSVGKGNTVVLYEATVHAATDVLGLEDLFDETTGARAALRPAEKRFLADFAEDFGIVPDNLEGLAFGPPLPDGRELLVVVSDNNFFPFQVTQFVALALEVEPAGG